MKRFAIVLGLIIAFLISSCGAGSSPTYNTSVVISQPTTTTPQQMVAYYTINDGNNFYRWSAPNAVVVSSPTSTIIGVASQVANANGSITLNIIHSPGYADCGFYLPAGVFGDLNKVTITTTGSAQILLNIWFDTSGDGDFFLWSGNLLTNINGDAYAAATILTSSGGTTTIDYTTPFYIMAAPDGSAGSTYTLSQLKAGAAPSLMATTPIALWVGITNTSGSDGMNASVTVTKVRVQ